MRPDVTGENINLVFFEKFFGFLLAGLGAETVIFKYNFGRDAAHLVTDMVHGYFNGRFLLLSDQCSRCRQRGDKTDFYVFRLGRCRKGDSSQRREP